MTRITSRKVAVALALFAGAAFFTFNSHAASCCGGGSASSLTLPKFGSAMIDVSMDSESYDGFFNDAGSHVPDPPGSDLSQTRLNTGFAYRLNANWQASVILPYVWNDNQYAGFSTQTSGLGDATASVWYEAFDNITCVYQVNTIADLKPAMYYGLSLTIPTGVSPYDDVANSFDITGRGFYRLDGSLLIDKTIYPWNASVQYSYGTYIERPVNREYGNYVTPYDKDLGDRSLASLSFGYTHFTESAATITFTLAYSDMYERQGEVNGVIDSTSGVRKQALAYTVAFSTFDKDWIYKLSYNQARDGENFPKTNILTMGVSHVFF